MWHHVVGLRIGDFNTVNPGGCTMDFMAVIPPEDMSELRMELLVHRITKDDPSVKPYTPVMDKYNVLQLFTMLRLRFNPIKLANFKFEEKLSEEVLRCYIENTPYKDLKKFLI